MVSTSVFDFVDRGLTQVSYLKLSPPIEIFEGECPRLGLRLRPEQLRLAPPPDIAGIIHDLVSNHDELEPGTTHFENRVKEYEARVKEGRFAEKDNCPTDKSTENASKYRVFSQLLADSARFQAARVNTFRDYLTRSGFPCNRMHFAARLFRETRTPDQLPVLEIELQKSDCYSYRVIGAVAKLLGSSFWQDTPPPRVGQYLLDYMAGDCIQRNTHNGFGLDLVVHTARDNRIIITRRSPNVENSSGSAGKYFESVCEALDDGDLDEINADALKPWYKVFQRGLKEELIYADPLGGDLGTDLLDNRIRHRFITGAMLYLPNMSINLCGVVSFDCSADEIRQANFRARDSHFEGRIIDELQGDPCLLEFSVHGVENFIKGTVGNGTLADVWDEGSLVTLALSTLAMSGTSAKASADRARSWTQTDLDAAIRKYKASRASTYCDLIEGVKRGRAGAKKDAQRLFGRNQLARTLGVKSGAMVTKSPAWQEIAEELKLPRRGSRRLRRIGMDIAEEKKAVSNSEFAADPVIRRETITLINESMPPTECEATIEKLVRGEITDDAAREIVSAFVDQKKDARTPYTRQRP